jgi:hypothetical protein
MLARDQAGREAIIEAIGHARGLEARHGTPRTSNGDVRPPLRSIQVLLDLGLTDDAIAGYLLRFDVLSTEERLRPGPRPLA